MKKTITNYVSFFSAFDTMVWNSYSEKAVLALKKVINEHLGHERWLQELAKPGEDFSPETRSFLNRKFTSNGDSNPPNDEFRIFVHKDFVEQVNNLMRSKAIQSSVNNAYQAALIKDIIGDKKFPEEHEESYEESEESCEKHEALSPETEFLCRKITWTNNFEDLLALDPEVQQRELVFSTEPSARNSNINREITERSNILNRYALFIGTVNARQKSLPYITSNIKTLNERIRFSETGMENIQEYLSNRDKYDQDIAWLKKTIMPYLWAILPQSSSEHYGGRQKSTEYSLDEKSVQYIASQRFETALHILRSECEENRQRLAILKTIQAGKAVAKKDLIFLKMDDDFSNIEEKAFVIVENAASPTTTAKPQ